VVTTPRHIYQGLKFFKRRLLQRGFKRYAGSVLDVCRQIVEDNWNGTYFGCGRGNHTIVYLRDLAVSAKALVNTGFKKEVQGSLRFMLDRFRRRGKITTTIDEFGIAYNTFEYASDSVPLALHALRVSESWDTVRQHREFLSREILRFYRNVVHKASGLAKVSRTFSTAKDNHKRPGSTYDNMSILLLDRELDVLSAAGLGLQNPLKRYDGLEAKVLENSWTGSLFRDYPGAGDYVAADANTFPYFWGAVSDKAMMQGSLRAIQDAGLDRPIPLRWTGERVEKTGNRITRLFAPNYQGNSCWTLLGGVYLRVLEMAEDPAFEKTAELYHDLIDRERTCLELYDPDGTPYETPFYRTDEAMLWSAIVYDVLARRETRKRSQAANGSTIEV
jgi:hypothetical protein